MRWLCSCKRPVVWFDCRLVVSQKVYPYSFDSRLGVNHVVDEHFSDFDYPKELSQTQRVWLTCLFFRVFPTSDQTNNMKLYMKHGTITLGGKKVVIQASHRVKLHLMITQEVTAVRLTVVKKACFVRAYLTSTRALWTHIKKFAIFSQNPTIWVSMDSPGPKQSCLR